MRGRSDKPLDISSLPIYTPKEAPDMSYSSRKAHSVPSMLDCECDGIHHVKSCLYWDEWLDGDEADIAEIAQVTVLGPKPATSTKSVFEYRKACHHNQSPLTLPSGLVVNASAWRDVPFRRTPPDVGVYLDPCWFPADTFAYALGWTDFGLPTISDANVYRTAEAVLAHLAYGESVEVGCIGSHGRTGTFLALLVMMDSRATETTYGAKRAISYVRANHCHEAIETKSQERWISRMSGKMRRGDV